MPAGRPTEYNDSLVDKAYEYVESCEDEIENVVSQESEKYTMYRQRLKVNLPSIEGLALYLGINKSTIYEWEKIYAEFSDVINTLRDKQAIRLLNMGLSGDYNPMIAKALLSKHGYSEKQEVEQKTTIEDNRIDASKLSDDELRTLAEIQRKSRTSEKES